MPTVGKEGVLYKQGKTLHQWVKRWYVATKGELKYGKIEKKDKLKSIRLDATALAKLEKIDQGKRHGFRFKAPDGEHVLFADTVNDRDEWVAALKGPVFAASASTPAKAAAPTKAAEPVKSEPPGLPKADKVESPRAAGVDATKLDSPRTEPNGLPPVVVETHRPVELAKLASSNPSSPAASMTLDSIREVAKHASESPAPRTPQVRFADELEDDSPRGEAPSPAPLATSSPASSGAPGAPPGILAALAAANSSPTQETFADEDDDAFERPVLAPLSETDDIPPLAATTPSTPPATPSSPVAPVLPAAPPVQYKDVVTGPSVRAAASMFGGGVERPHHARSYSSTSSTSLVAPSETSHIRPIAAETTETGHRVTDIKNSGIFGAAAPSRTPSPSGSAFTRANGFTFAFPTTRGESPTSIASVKETVKSINMKPTVESVFTVAPAELAVPDLQTRKAASIEEFYELTDILGSGGFATVKVGSEKSSRQEWAVKEISRRLADQEGSRVWHEIRVLAKLNHENLIHLHEVVETPETVAIVMELLRGRELFDVISARDHISEADISSILRRIVGALAFLHNQGIAHSDIKPENLVFATSEAEDDDIRVVDFGFAHFVDSEEARNARQVYATPEYLAPELILRQVFGTSGDMWGLGVVAYILLSGYFPFYGESVEDLAAKIVQGHLDFTGEAWETVSESAKDLVTKLLTVVPKNRPTAAEVLEHPWITGETATAEPLAEHTVENLRKFNVRRKYKAAQKAVLFPIMVGSMVTTTDATRSAAAIALADVSDEDAVLKAKQASIGPTNIDLVGLVRGGELRQSARDYVGRSNDAEDMHALVSGARSPTPDLQERADGGRPDSPMSDDESDTHAEDDEAMFGSDVDEVPSKSVEQYGEEMIKKAAAERSFGGCYACFRQLALCRK